MECGLCTPYCLYRMRQGVAKINNKLRLAITLEFKCTFLPVVLTQSEPHDLAQSQPALFRPPDELLERRIDELSPEANTKGNVFIGCT